MQHFESVIACCKDNDFSGEAVNPHVAALAGIGRVLWHQGFADQARAKVRESIALAERSRQPANLAQSISMASGLYHELREPENAQGAAERLFEIASKGQLAPSLSFANVSRGWAMAERGRADEGIALIREGLDSLRGRGTSIVPLIALSEAQSRTDRPDAALISIEQALSAAGEQRINLLRARWRRGELFAERGDHVRARDDFRDVIEVALGAPARRHTNCAPRPASRGCSTNRASARRRARCSPKSTTGSPRASTPPI